MIVDVGGAVAPNYHELTKESGLGCPKVRDMICFSSSTTIDGLVRSRTEMETSDALVRLCAERDKQEPRSRSGIAHARNQMTTCLSAPSLFGTERVLGAGSIKILAPPPSFS